LTGKTNNIQPVVPQNNLLDNTQDTNESDDIILHRITFDRGPYFDLTASKNITALVGKTAYLNCRVKNIGNRTVSF
jgi:subtilase family serine protease